MTNKNQPPEIERNVAIAHNGKNFYGGYIVRGDVVTVQYFGVPGGATKSALLDGAALHVAQVLLRELVSEHERTMLETKPES